MNWNYPSVAKACTSGLLTAVFAGICQANEIRIKRRKMTDLCPLSPTFLGSLSSSPGNPSPPDRIFGPSCALLTALRAHCGEIPHEWCVKSTGTPAVDPVALGDPGIRAQPR